VCPETVAEGRPLAACCVGCQQFAECCPLRLSQGLQDLNVQALHASSHRTGAGSSLHLSTAQSTHGSSMVSHAHARLGVHHEAASIQLEMAN
jgi:hypothetical protein